MQLVSLGIIFGILWFVVVRFALYSNDETHYHANFVVYVDGERYPFDRFIFYEEVEICGTASEFNPKARVHMHNTENHVVHVHDDGST